MQNWLAKLSPDIAATVQRFPFAIVLTALTTLIGLGAINNIEPFLSEPWARAALGLATGACLAVAGVYFAESRPEARFAGLLLKYALPVLAVALFEVTATEWVVPFALPTVAVLWLSVSPFTRIGSGAEREEQQNRFWWVNHQAISTAVIAGAGFLIIAIGIAAIERSLSILFGLESGQLFYQWVLPFAGLFLTPVYWYSTLPRIAEYRAEEMQKPEFLSRAIGFLGQFVLVPLLLIYGLILLAYTAQIVLLQALPQGMIGWMVTGFVIIGAGTWLVLHPPFMRDRLLVRLFRSVWFWLTAVPLALFFLAVWVRIDAYGLTEERVLLVAGGVWAVALALLFLLRRGDIRAIPALAGIILLALSVGPWNFMHLPVLQQSMRLDALLAQPGANGASFPPDWTAEEAQRARGSIDYLARSEPGQSALVALLGRYEVDYAPATDTVGTLLAELGQSAADPTQPDAPTRQYLRRDGATDPVDVAATPLLLGPLRLYTPGTAAQFGLVFEVVDGVWRVWPFNKPSIDVPLGDWLAGQAEGKLAQPWIDFAIEGRAYRFALDELELDRVAGEPPRVAFIAGTLFAAPAAPETAPPPVATDAAPAAATPPAPAPPNP